MRRYSMDPTKKKYRSFRILTVLTVAALMLAGCSTGRNSGLAQTDLKVRAAQTEAITMKKIGDPIEQVAEVQAVNVLDIVPKVNGEVIAVLKTRGQYVEKGDILFQIDSKDALSAKQRNELSLTSAQQSLQKAKDDQANNQKDLADAVSKAETALQNAEEDYNKVRNQFDAGKAAQHDVDVSKQQMDNARMNMESTQSKLSAMNNTNSIASYETQAKSAALAVQDSNRSLENYSTKAPSSGFLTDFAVTVGQTVTSNSKIGQVQQVDPIKIKTELSETGYALVKNKKELTYSSPDSPDLKGTAKISYLAPVMSAQTKSYTLELEVPNSDHRIEPGSRIMVQLTTETEQLVVAIPTLSIIHEGSNSYVFVKQGDQYQRRQVKLGRINGSIQEVIEGLSVGDQLVVTGQNQLVDGQKVDAAQPSPAAPAKANSK
jgi:multidrug efflux pump subunit AcrA (membrane-fusion protein)